MDPTTMSIGKRPQDQTALMKALGDETTGRKVNACPFGCEDEDLDDNGYCHHLIGFTNNSEAECKAGKGSYEPMVYDEENDRRQVQVPKKVEGKRKVPQLSPVLKTDVIIPITVSARVYRNVEKKAAS